jgi:hypothetical protein
MFIDEGDVRAHGKDERLRTESFQGCEFLYRLAKQLSGGREAPLALFAGGLGSSSPFSGFANFRQAAGSERL